jgi:hypothetical protein
MLNSDGTNGHGLLTGILIVLFLFLTAALVITWNVPATGFEPSIYKSTPLVLWVALITSVIAGISIVIHAATSPDTGRSIVWKYGLLLIFLCYATGLSLFMIRGYYMWAMTGDPATHIGYIHDILQTGYISKTVFYPVTHIFLSEICLVTNLSPAVFYTTIPFFMGLLCVVFIFFFARVLSDNRTEPVIAGILACTFIYGSYLNLTPNGLSNLFLPLVLFFLFKYLKTNKFSWAILLCIVLILYPVFHPLPSILLALFLITLWIPQKTQDIWYSVWEKKRNFLNTQRINTKVMIPFLILTTWFILWYSLNAIWGLTITEVYQKINAEGGPTKLTDLSNTVNYAQGFGYNIFEIILKSYGNLLVFSILSVIAFFLLWKKVTREHQEGNLFSLYGPWAFLCILVPVLYFFNLPFGPLRFISYIFILETVIVAYLIYYILTRSNTGKSRFLSGLVKGGVVVLITGLFVIGLLNLYASPWNLTISYQSTHSEVAGMDYFLKYRDMSNPVSGFNVAVGRFADLLLPQKERAAQHLPQYIKKENYPPWHFGYDQFPSIASSYPNETYLILPQSEKSRYTDYYPEMAKYRITMQDYERLNNDPGANLLYSNGGFDFLAIIPEK